MKKSMTLSLTKEEAEFLSEALLFVCDKLRSKRNADYMVEANSLVRKLSELVEDDE